MKISYHKVNFEMDFKFPENLEEINNHINSVWRNLPSLTITSDQNLLDETINITQELKKNKKRKAIKKNSYYNFSSQKKNTHLFSVNHHLHL